jgi:hypothetical protein
MFQPFLFDWCYALKNIYVDHMGLSSCGFRSTRGGFN